MSIHLADGVTPDDGAPIVVKRCPFCPGDARVVQTAMSDDGKLAHRSAHVVCRLCCAVGPVCESEADALARWNTRPVMP